jgi:hypothetical protein
VVGGLLVSQILTLFTTPVVYLYLDRLSLWLQGRPSAAPGRHGDARPSRTAIGPLPRPATEAGRRAAE